MKFSKNTKERLGYYVYALVDPRDNKIFYVGKASSNNRAFQHLAVSSNEAEKCNRIREIKSSGVEPRIEILRHGLKTEQVALEVEAVVIDAIGLENLTNVVRGHGIENGRLHASELERRYGAKPVVADTIKEDAIMFFIHNKYSPTQSEQELYDSTRQFWHNVSVSTRTKLAHRLALGVVESVVIRVYSIEGWHAAGATYSSRVFSGESINRWEFVGQLLPNHLLTGRQIVNQKGEPIQATQNGYRYVSNI